MEEGTDGQPECRRGAVARSGGLGGLESKAGRHLTRWHFLGTVQTSLRRRLYAVASSWLAIRTSLQSSSRALNRCTTGPSSWDSRSALERHAASIRRRMQRHCGEVERLHLRLVASVTWEQPPGSSVVVCALAVSLTPWEWPGIVCSYPSARWRRRSSSWRPWRS